VLTRAQLLGPLARHRTNEVVVTTMSVTRPWGRLSDHDLDFASTDSAMGHAADLALGIALARPDRTVVCLNGDGSMLMALGTLATAVGARAENFVLIVVDNGVYEITGNQPVAASGSIDYAVMAVAAGFPRVFRFDDAREYVEAVPGILERSPEAPGPTLVHVRVEPGTEGPISRSDSEAARYLRVSIAEWSRMLRDALAANPA
jgi:thiamine pyrophosphate-dependent acetolactate synthase large subunit-like protein